MIETRLTPKFPGFYVPGICIAMFLGIALCYILRNLERSRALAVFYHRDRVLFYFVIYITVSVSSVNSDLTGKKF